MEKYWQSTHLAEVRTVNLAMLSTGLGSWSIVDLFGFALAMTLVTAFIDWPNRYERILVDQTYSSQRIFRPSWAMDQALPLLPVT